MNNFRNATEATLLYSGDYDDRFLPTNHRPGLPADPVLDRTWVQILMPYVRAFRTFECPAEPNNTDFGAVFDPDLMPGDYAARYYNASLHSDLGYNSYYLSPTVWTGSNWASVPRATTEVSDPSRMLLFIESRADSGGGSYLVAPPCRYVLRDNRWVDTFRPAMASAGGASGPAAIYIPVPGWDPGKSADASMPFGGAWPRHGNQMNISRVDGSARSTTLNALTEGCVVRPNWQGPITDPPKYVWFPQN